MGLARTARQRFPAYGRNQGLRCVVGQRQICTSADRALCANGENDSNSHNPQVFCTLKIMRLLSHFSISVSLRCFSVTLYQMASNAAFLKYDKQKRDDNGVGLEQAVAKPKAWPAR